MLTSIILGVYAAADGRTSVWLEETGPAVSSSPRVKGMAMLRKQAGT